MNNTQWKNWLKNNHACIEGYKEAKDLLPNDWYKITKRGDWIIWVLRKLPAYKENKELWVKITIESAKMVVHLTKDTQEIHQKAIETAQNCLNNPSEENKMAASAASNLQIANIIRQLIPVLNTEEGGSI